MSVRGRRGKSGRAARVGGWRALILGALLVPVGVLAAGSERPAQWRDGIPANTLILLQHEGSGIAAGSQGAVVYGSVKERGGDLLRQIAAATNAGAQWQLELLRQQNEIIRLLAHLGRGRGDGR
jgi:hypothetical protein